VVRARMRWNSENGVPRGSKNGSGAIIRMCMEARPDRAGGVTKPTCYTTPPGATAAPAQTMADSPGTPARGFWRSTLIWTLKIVTSAGLLYVLLTRVDLGLLWQTARSASPAWLAAALASYFIMVLLSAWRWDLLLRAQHVHLTMGALTNSFLVATFFNNFLPSNIGGDVVRVADTAGAAGSKTLATTVVLLDRGLGLLGLLFVAALGATGAARASQAVGPLGPGVLWAALAGGLAATGVAIMRSDLIALALRPLYVIHQEWVSERINRLVGGLARFRQAPGKVLACLAGAVLVQGILVIFYAAIARGLGIDVSLAHLGLVVPLTFVIQMLPISVNGFGVREATFGFYFAQLNLSLEAALALSFLGAVLIMLFSTSGAIVYLARGSRRQHR